MALRPVVGFSLAGMASLLTRPFRRAAGAGPLWRRRRSVTQFRGTFQRDGGIFSPGFRLPAAHLPRRSGPERVCSPVPAGPQPERVLVMSEGNKGNMVDPVPTQCMMVDREFPRRPFDRRTGGKKPFDPRAFEVLASLTASRPRTSFSPHRPSPLMSFKKFAG